ncbi:tRNA-uridine aminocarboxypropyltransferase 1-like isoform X2 [Amphibalanus amphitrite]|nr:tRNA-uridine aminocarboxypropyltransferase 1-like isoform X2 [Amphibalanus amphitrite]XP_043204856.1 tRNA-uridine aminocarboxypropyltransferase 1-like isoform X2 [Amphibalanus amphitrite]XP_043204857.1 tRNA-uridine aminocarboxypropyltransferase 1-like isoform X2 [Amphibalanus amphitrite]XP_043204858.1 tRNA-uridine aminocarboxypropyltransferase 1-like isoform X2 [Amphibalanus amphitrite]XP_043204859.1 tRNA-uridine aminocarboxypropyltransferase 1-like isoform X2 [Amphibalanus amphitrite]XP_04
MTSLQPAEPFKHLNISSAEVLERLTERSPCPKCHKSRMYFCYNCLVPVDALTGKIPYVPLPVEVEIVKHPGETNGKSTAVHAAVLAPDDVTLRTYPDVGSYDPDETVLVFPDSSAGSVADVSAEFAAAGRPLRRALFLDCTWNQCRRLLDSDQLRGLRCVQLREHETRFWRYQRGKPRTHLATIEAVYYFVRELQESRHDTYGGEFDDLLFFFDHFYRTVFRSRAAGSLWAYRTEDTWVRPSERERQNSDSEEAGGRDGSGVTNGQLERAP